MKTVVRILLVLVAVWLQVSFFGAFRIFDVLPNVLLVVIIYAGLIIDASAVLTMALIGGLLLGITENWGSAIFGTQWKDVVAFALLVLILLVRPTGLLGQTLGRARA